jgi:K+-sensing histidine kinase KdpD
MLPGVSPQRRIDLLALLAGALLPIAVAAALVPQRHSLGNTNTALILVAVVVLVSALGRRSAAAVAAISAFVGFDYFHTLPYHTLSISHHEDLVTALLLLALGLLTGQIAAISLRNQTRAREQRHQLDRIHAIAELVSDGAEASLVVLAVGHELTSLLDLEACHFDAAPGDAKVPRIDHTGDLIHGRVRWGVETLGLPSPEVDLAVQRSDRFLGRFVLTPRPGRVVPAHRLVTAVILADLAASTLDHEHR